MWVHLCPTDCRVRLFCSEFSDKLFLRKSPVALDFLARSLVSAIELGNVFVISEEETSTSFKFSDRLQLVCRFPVLLLPLALTFPLVRTRWSTIRVLVEVELERKHTVDREGHELGNRRPK